MKKSAPHGGDKLPWTLLKILMIMKLTLFIVLLTAFQVYAHDAKGQNINMDVRNIEIRKVLNSIEQNGYYRFLYNYDLRALKSKVDFIADNLAVSDALDKLLAGNGLTYKIVNKNLIAIFSTNADENKEIRVTGTITGPNNENLAGVSVQEKGTGNGTTTSNNGEYSLTVGDNATLIISNIGYENQEVAVNGRSVVDVKLVSAIQQMDQVIVVGYGSQRKKDLTGAVSVVTSADIANRPIVNAGEALQGKAAGVQVVSNSGKPGAGLSIRIRGSSSISAGNDPLYVVDGIPMTDISTFNPGDIESMSVLKDAASASIYGTRAANGVVVITTKKGVANKSRIDFGYYYGGTSTTKKLKVLDGSQYQDLIGEIYAKQTTPQPNPITDSMVAANNINWPDEVFRNGSQSNYQVAISGGSDKVQHFVSLNYNDQVGMIRPATFNRLSGRVNLTAKTTNWLTLTTSTIVSRTNQKGVTDNASIARGGVVLSALATPPTVGKYNADGSIAQNPFTGWENPLGSIEGQSSKSITDRIVSNMGAEIRLWKGLVFQSRFGIDYVNNLNNFFLDPFLTQDGRNNQGRLTETKSTQLTWLSEQTLNYTKAIGKNHFAILAGWTAQDSHFDQTVNGASKLDTTYRHQSFNQMFLRSQIKNPPVKSIDDWALISYLGRITYDFDGKYLLQANIRSDRSSKFAPDNRTATFPSFSAGWRISEENFFRKVKLFDDLKIRAGWGQNGNQEGIGSYQYLPLSDFYADGLVHPVTTTVYNLTWETSTQTNIGIDASILNRRINFSADFYVKNTKDVLVNYPLPAQAGFPISPLNRGSLRNVGQEFVISSRNIVSGPLKWNTDLNLSFNKNKVITIGNGISFLNGYGSIYERGNATALVEGYGLGEFYGYVVDKVDPATGKLLYQTNKGTSVPYSETNPSDRRLIGSAQPKFVYGLSNNLSYKNFDLTVFIQGSQGNKIFNGARVEMEGMKDSRNQSPDVLGRWQNPGDISSIPGVAYQSNDNTQISTRFLEDGSYLRFKTITLAYKFSEGLLRKAGLGAATIYVSAQNLITVTKYKGFDPEVNTYGTADQTTDNRNISLGVDYGAYPQAKVILFGVNVSLK